ncbi:MAG: hypothetical protein Q9228_004945 [Teloschistes exilis]
MNTDTSTRLEATDDNTIDVDYWIVQLADFSTNTRRAWPKLVMFADMGEGYWRQLCENIVQTIEDPTVMDASLWLLYLEPLKAYYSDESVELDDGSHSDDADDSEDAGEADELDASSDPDNDPDSSDRLDDSGNVNHLHNSESSDDETDSDSDSSSRSYDTNNSTGRNRESRNLLQHLIFTLPDHLPLTKQSVYKSLMTWSHTLKTKYHSCPLHKNTDIIAGSRLDGFRLRIEVAHEALFRPLTGRQSGDTICVDGRTAERWNKQDEKRSIKDLADAKLIL